MFTQDCSDCLTIQVFECLPNGKLPNHSEVLDYFLYLQCSYPRMRVDMQNLTHELMLHWIYCNVYTVSIKTVRKELDFLVQEYQYLKKYPIPNRGDSYWMRFNTFINVQSTLFDIKVEDNKCLKKMKIFGMLKCQMMIKYFMIKNRNPDLATVHLVPKQNGDYGTRGDTED